MNEQPLTLEHLYNAISSLPSWTALGVGRYVRLTSTSGNALMASPGGGDIQRLF